MAEMIAELPLIQVALLIVVGPVTAPRMAAAYELPTLTAFDHGTMDIFEYVGVWLVCTTRSISVFVADLRSVSFCPSIEPVISSATDTSRFTEPRVTSDCR